MSIDAKKITSLVNPVYDKKEQIEKFPKIEKPFSEVASKLLNQKVGTNSKGEKMTGSEALINVQFKKAMQGDTKATEFLMNITGQSIKN